MFIDKKIMVVAAHPDDELLGVGATIHKLIRNYKNDCRAVILGEGITSRNDVRDVELWKGTLAEHKRNMKEASNIIGYNSERCYDFSDNRFDHHDLLDIVKTVEKEIVEFKPDIIFTHHGGDLNIDHQLTFQAVMTATRPMEDEVVKTIITFETPSATEWQSVSDPRHFSPNLFIEIEEEDIEAKIKAMDAYRFESRLFPHPRSSEALMILAKYRGYIIGRNMAEAFQIIRSIN